MRDEDGDGGNSAFAGLVFALLVLLIAFYLDSQQRNQIEDLRHRVTMLELQTTKGTEKQ